MSGIVISGTAANTPFDNIGTTLTSDNIQEALATVSNLVDLCTDPSNIIQNSTNRFVTDAEKTTWNAGGGGGSGNVDGGIATSMYGGTTPIDGGGA